MHLTLIIASILLVTSMARSAPRSDNDSDPLNINPGHHRGRRQSIGLLSPLTQEERQAIADKHNEFRRAATNPTASNMQHMVYDLEVEHWVEQWLIQCQSYHGRADGTPDTHGQNLWLGSSKPPTVQPVIAWHDEEIKHYTYETKSCADGKVCGHYTQVVWDESSKVGCARVFCETAYKKNGNEVNNQWIYACHYDPKGNARGAWPYLGGPPCTGCSEGKTKCIQGLCTDCSGEGVSGCDCKLICENCAQRNENDCTCNCLQLNYYDYRCSNYEETVGECPKTNEVRLVGGQGSYEGRVQVKFPNGDWGSVCSSTWDINHTTVVCKQLGFDGADANQDGLSFGVETLGITMYNTACNGSETYLAECTFNQEHILTGNCEHGTDVAAVRCQHGINCVNTCENGGIPLPSIISNQCFCVCPEDARGIECQMASSLGGVIIYKSGEIDDYTQEEGDNIQRIVADALNDYCHDHFERCCPNAGFSKFNSAQTFITVNDINTIAGNPRHVTGSNPTYDILVAVTEPVDSELCSPNVKRKRRQAELTGTFLESQIVMDALEWPQADDNPMEDLKKVASSSNTIGVYTAMIQPKAVEPSSQP